MPGPNSVRAQPQQAFTAPCPLPLIVDGQVLGALNVYAHVRDAFAGSSQRVGEQFAQVAAVAIHNARLLDQTQRHATHLAAALKNRGTIE